MDQLSAAGQGLWQWLWEPIPYSHYPWLAAVVLALILAFVVGFTLLFAIPWARRWWTDETPRPGEDEQGVSTQEMSLMEHLLELRNRLVISAIALAVTTGGAFIFYQKWMDIALRPIAGHELQAISPTEKIFTYFQVTLVVGLLIAMPVLAYEAWAYIAPGLTRKERRYVIAFIPGVTVCFIIGVAFAYFVLLPAALGFLLSFGDPNIKVVPTIESYVKFLSHLMIATGLIFEMPLVMFFLAKLRLVNAKMLGGMRRYVIVASFIVAAIVTPTPDPFNQLLVAVPILVLYEVGVLLSRLA
jgi:sec-independent protein translocase protein TatC